MYYVQLSICSCRFHWIPLHSNSNRLVLHVESISIGSSIFSYISIFFNFISPSFFLSHLKEKASKFAKKRKTTRGIKIEMIRNIVTCPTFVIANFNWLLFVSHVYSVLFPPDSSSPLSASSFSFYPLLGLHQCVRCKWNSIYPPSCSARLFHSFFFLSVFTYIPFYFRVTLSICQGTTKWRISFVSVKVCFDGASGLFLLAIVPNFEEHFIRSSF